MANFGVTETITVNFNEKRREGKERKVNIRDVDVVGFKISQK
ncbi:MAG: hypothetical protein ACI8YQ_002973 [Polaribacter sp.]|jgi:hypothetical protein